MQQNKNELIGKQMLSESKFYMGYSRWVDIENRYETWEESVKRVMDMHRTKYADKLTPELEELISFAEVAYKEKRVLGAQRALQFGGEQLFKHEARMYNCLKKDTEFTTSDGVKSFNDYSDGDEIKVLTHTGKWKKATVKQFGKQKLNKISFVKNNSKVHEVFATENHRWLLKDGSETTNIKIGDSLLKPTNTFSEFDYKNANPKERLYWCYGMVYGDGTKVQDSNGVNKYSMIRLCGTDKQFSKRFEELGFKTSTNDSLNGVFIAYTGTYLKTAPNPEVDSPELIRAFVSGYLQADGSIYKSELMGVKQLEYVKLAQQYWVEYGTNVELCVDPNLRHNVSNTITVDDWDEVEQYIFDNREWFAGISLLSAMGDKAYPQAPFTEVFTAEEILKKYGNASLMASGLIVDGLTAFNQNLWVACDTVNGWGMKLDVECKEQLLKRDWVRRANKFSVNYFNGDVLEMTNCLKDCFNLHKWTSINRTMKAISFADELKEKHYVDASSLGAQGCSGGACEISF